MADNITNVTVHDLHYLHVYIAGSPFFALVSLLGLKGWAKDVSLNCTIAIFVMYLEQATFQVPLGTTKPTSIAGHRLRTV